MILLVRGGGSLEDLWAFNEEIVARAIVASKIPIATGIGHEPDTTIADLVGDLRGATPTAVTELTIPDVKVLLGEIEGQRALLTRDVRRIAERARSMVEGAEAELTGAAREALRDRIGRIDQLQKQIARIEPRHAVAQGWRRLEEGERKLSGALVRRVRLRMDVVNRAAASWSGFRRGRWWNGSGIGWRSWRRLEHAAGGAEDGGGPN